MDAEQKRQLTKRLIQEERWKEAENWKNRSARTVVSADSVGTLIRLHEELELREFSCPNCGRLLSLDVARKGDPDLFDIEIRTGGA